MYTTPPCLAAAQASSGVLAKEYNTASAPSLQGRLQWSIWNSKMRLVLSATIASKQGACFVNRERTLKQICGMLLSGGTCSARHSKSGINRSSEAKTAANPGLLVRRF
uniref:Similar to GRV2 (KATAMARI2) n=1 Tax=Arundo donax TaxID=35708 RepID=A0A0A9G5Z1_ARUDO